MDRIPRLKIQFIQLFTHNLWENILIHNLFNYISAIWNANSLVKDLNSGFSSICFNGNHYTTSVNIYIYIYIYIYWHPQTDYFVLSELFSVARHEGRLKLEPKPAHLYVRLSIRRLGQQAYHVSLGNYKILCGNISSSVRLFTFYTLPDARVLDSFEQLCNMRAAAVNPFSTYPLYVLYNAES